MGITGSDLAYKQARFGVARFGASRVNYYAPNVVFTINGTDRTSAVMFDEPHRVTLNKNDEPDSAEFTIKPGAGFVPTAGQTVNVSLGAAGNLEFAGQIISVSHDRPQKDEDYRYHVTCTDWRQLANRRLVTGNFSGQSATDIAESIAEHMDGFTTEAVESGLPTVDEFICINETVTSALSRLATLIGGAFYIDPYKRIHLWDSSGPSSSYTHTNPLTLTETLPSLKRFEPEYDFSQVRTRVIVEGRSAKVMEAIPVGADVATYGIPLDHDGQWIFNPATSAEANYARIGSMVVAYDEVDQVTGPPALFVAVAASAGDTGLEFTPGSTGAPTGSPPYWFYDASGKYFAADGLVSGTPNDSLTFIPASGYGSLKVDLPVGTPVFQCGRFLSVTPQTDSGAVDVAVDEGEAVVARVQVDDSAAQTAIAAIEGGNGIHEHSTTESEATWVGCMVRAEAELAAFGSALVRARWVTFDMNAVPGTTQVINIASPALSTTLTIDSVTLEFPVYGHPPRRTCEGSTVKLASVLDLIKG